MALKSDQELKHWSESAAGAGDATTMLIAEIALGNDPISGMSVAEIRETWALDRPADARMLRRLTPRGAARLAAKW